MFFFLSSSRQLIFYGSKERQTKITVWLNLAKPTESLNSSFAIRYKLKIANLMIDNCACNFCSQVSWGRIVNWYIFPSWSQKTQVVQFSHVLIENVGFRDVSQRDLLQSSRTFSCGHLDNTHTYDIQSIHLVHRNRRIHIITSSKIRTQPVRVLRCAY